MATVYCVNTACFEARKYWFPSKKEAKDFIRKERPEVNYIDDEPTRHVVPTDKHGLLHWLNTYCTEGSV